MSSFRARIWPMVVLVLVPSTLTLEMATVPMAVPSPRAIAGAPAALSAPPAKSGASAQVVLHHASQDPQQQETKGTGEPVRPVESTEDRAGGLAEANLAEVMAGV